MTIDILICSLNKGIVKVPDVLLPASEGVRYIVSYQYTDERYLDLIPNELKERADITLYQYKGEGLSANRNLAMDKAKADLIIFADDDARFTDSSIELARSTFENNPDLDVAFFTASTYTGKSLKDYPKEERLVTEIPKDYSISAIEMVCRRSRVQSVVRFDERFGLGTKFLTCGEEDIWLTDALRLNLTMKYFPKKLVETSTMLKKSLVYIDAGVQRSRGAFEYYIHGLYAWIVCFKFAFHSATKGYCHFIPMMRHLSEGIIYMRRTERSN
jgi:glycosyltransferase involved in cell wall biosynthesis